MPATTDLDRLAARLVRSVHEGRHGPAVVGVPAHGGPPLVVPLRGRHPVQVLQEVRTASCWEGVIVVCTGRVIAHRQPVPPPDGRAPLPPDGDVVVGTATGRGGTDRSVLLGPDGRVVPVAEPPEGLVPDAARRVLGRPTPEPARPVTAWWAVEWLADVVGAVLGPSPPITLADVVSLHPAVDRHDAMGSDNDVVERVVQRGWDHAGVAGWEAVRCSVADGLLHDPWCPGPLAAWYDTGSFSRFVEATRPSAPALLAALRPLLAPNVAGAVDAILAGWHLDSRPTSRGDGVDPERSA